MQRFTLILCVLSMSIGLNAQSLSLWQTKQIQDLPLSEAVQQPEGVHFKQFRSYQLDYEQMQQQLSAIPKEGQAGSRSPHFISLPMPDGGSELFEIFDAPNMKPALAAKYPGIRSFAGKAVNQINWTIRLGYSYQGFYAMIHTKGSEIYIEPFDWKKPEYYRVFKMGDVETSLPFVCGVTGNEINPTTTQYPSLNEVEPVATSRSGGPVELLVYDFALACNGEFAQMMGGTKEDVMSAFDRAMAQLNLIYQVETAIHFQLVSNNDILIYLDPTTDPYNADPTDGGALLNENQTLLDGIIRPQNYDIGHMFTIGCAGGLLGIAGGNTCTATKGAGVTCHSSRNIEPRVRSTMAHEVGHQFTAQHSFDNCPGRNGNRNSSTSYEPGGGSTIMAYSSCPGNNYIPGQPRDVYFNIGSLVDIYSFSRERNGFGCATVDVTDNHLPDLSLNYTDGFYIPISTSFKLTADASDIDNDPITYCWEQFDLGPNSELGSPRGDAPSFRSFPAVDNPTRYFPNLDNIINNQSDFSEVLPTYSRNLTFRCTVRDNVPDKGGVVWQEVAFKATDQAGPFLVNNPNGFDSWEAGEWREIQWDVANTDQAPVNCKFVNIKLSTNDGRTFPITLAAEVPNNGSYFITVPEVTTTAARVLVEAADNIFFDMSNQFFSILPATRATYGFQLDRYTDQICLPEQTSFDLVTESIMNYEGEIRYEVSGLPTAAIAEFSVNPVLPTENSTLNIDFSNVEEEGRFEVELTAFSESDTLVRTLFLDLFFSDFSQVAPMIPEDGTTGLVDAPTLIWRSSPFADTYTVELATSPAFGNSIVASISGITDTFFLPTDLLEKNTPHYWRVLPANECGDGDYTRVYGFNTESVSCGSQPSSDVPKPISSAGTPLVTSNMEVTNSFTIEDLDVVNINITHDRVRDIYIELISPAGTVVRLFDGQCGNTSAVKLSLDDEAPTDIPCPPTGNNTHIPAESLAAFDGEDAKGNWRLRVKVTDGFGNGGWLDGWGLQFCSSISLNPPRLIRNDTLPVTGVDEVINSDFLLVEDDNNGPEELTFTMVTDPMQGDIYRDGSRLDPGDTFTQDDVDKDRVSYVFTGGTELVDRFQFSVNDGEGGWYGTPDFVLVLDQATGTKTIGDPTALKLFPNPANSEVFVQLDNQRNEIATLNLFNVQGQLVRNFALNTAAGGRTLDLNAINSGLYIVRVSTQDAIYTQKLMIQK